MLQANQQQQQPPWRLSVRAANVKKGFDFSLKASLSTTNFPAVRNFFPFSIQLKLHRYLFKIKSSKPESKLRRILSITGFKAAIFRRWRRGNSTTRTIKSKKPGSKLRRILRSIIGKKAAVVRRGNSTKNCCNGTTKACIDDWLWALILATAFCVVVLHLSNYHLEGGRGIVWKYLFKRALKYAAGASSSPGRSFMPFLKVLFDGDS